MIDGEKALCQLPELHPRVIEIEPALFPCAGCPLSLVDFFPLCAGFAAIAFYERESCIRNSVIEKSWCRAQKRVAALNLAFEEGERFARFDSFHPQIYFAELDGHWIDVHAID